MRLHRWARVTGSRRAAPAEAATDRRRRARAALRSNRSMPHLAVALARSAATRRPALHESPRRAASSHSSERRSFAHYDAESSARRRVLARGLCWTKSCDAGNPIRSRPRRSTTSSPCFPLIAFAKSAKLHGRGVLRILRMQSGGSGRRTRSQTILGMPRTRVRASTSPASRQHQPQRSTDLFEVGQQQLAAEVGNQRCSNDARAWAPSVLDRG